MKKFTPNEKIIMTNNVNKILEFVKFNVSPYIRESQYLKYKDDPSHRDIMFIINPGKNASIEFTRGFNSTEYYLNDKYDSAHTKRERNHRTCFFDSYDEMFALIENWPNLKQSIMTIVEHDKNISNTLNIFNV